MILQSILPNGSIPVVFDASVVINFLGTGIAGKLISSIGRPVLIEQHAFKEVKRHPIPGRDAEAELKTLIASDNFSVVQMTAQSRQIFYDLTADGLLGGLDDGEAATIALCVLDGTSHIPVLDERKAIKLLQRGWPGKQSISTLDLLMNDRLRHGFEAGAFADAIYLALQFAKMRVPSSYRDRVINLIGLERARTCACLGSISE